jgi:hypothetical protein
VPFGGCYSSMSRRIERAVFTDQWMWIVSKPIMRFVEEVVENSRLISIATGQQMPEIKRLQIGRGATKLRFPPNGRSASSHCRSSSV